MIIDKAYEEALEESRLLTLDWAVNVQGNTAFTSFVWGLVVLDLHNSQAYIVGDNGTLHAVPDDLFPEILRVSKFSSAHHPQIFTRAPQITSEKFMSHNFRSWVMTPNE